MMFLESIVIDVDFEVNFRRVVMLRTNEVFEYLNKKRIPVIWNSWILNEGSVDFDL